LDCPAAATSCPSCPSCCCNLLLARIVSHGQTNEQTLSLSN
jgi:hypothetical protein